jgi:hypothetical protein
VSLNGYNFLTASDFNHDGRIDLLLLNFQTGDNRLILQDGRGSFSEVLSVAGYQALNGYLYAAAGKFDSSDSGLDVFLFQP